MQWISDWTSLGQGQGGRHPLPQCASTSYAVPFTQFHSACLSHFRSLSQGRGRTQWMEVGAKSGDSKKSKEQQWDHTPEAGASRLPFTPTTLRIAIEFTYSDTRVFQVKFPSEPAATNRLQPVSVLYYNTKSRNPNLIQTTSINFTVLLVYIFQWKKF